VTRIPNIVALLGVLAVIGCTDSYPVPLPPDNVFYYPIGLAVRQMPPDPATAGHEHGSTQLVVVSSNFDLRYGQEGGGTVLVVDPDLSPDTSTGGYPAVYPGGFARVGSFGGEVAVVDAACQPGWPTCPSACPQLVADPAVAAGGAKVLLGARAIQTLYRMDMDPAGALTCGAGCITGVPIQLLDPYGVTPVCNASGGTDRAEAYFTYLRAPTNQGWLTRMDLVAGTSDVLTLGLPPTYGTTYDAQHDWLFVSGGLVLGLAPLRWINPSVENLSYQGIEYPVFYTYRPTGVVLGASVRAVAVSNPFPEPNPLGDRHLFVAVDLYDADLLANTGAYVLEGGAMVVFSIARGPDQQPRMDVQRIVPTCLGSGQLKVLPPRTGRRDLVALTCDSDGSLLLYDDELGFVTSYKGLDPDTGLPVLGRMPFGIATEPIDPARAIVNPSSSTYDSSPCGPGRSCDRLYVGSFYDNWVNVLELDPDRPETVSLVKRIGRGP
jgi:hypothetical protein